VKRWLLVIAGSFGVVTYLNRRRSRRAAAASGPELADELRSKLADTRWDAEPQTTPAAEVQPEPEPQAAPDQAPAADDLGERRSDVHDQARRAMDDLA
jgi:hypothetical protein